MAGAEGVAPSFPVLETGVLLLNYAPIIDAGQSDIFLALTGSSFSG